MHTSIVALRGNRVMLGKLGLALLGFVVMLGLPSQGRAQTTSVTLTPSVTSPQMLGTPVTWTAAVHHAPAGHIYDYQFTVTFNGQAQIVSDFSTTSTFTWVPHTVEGAYQFSVVVRDITTTPYVVFSAVSANFTLLPWVTTPLAAGVINPTSNPLVALFSGPPCTAGHQLLVRFHPVSSDVSMSTNLVPCSQQSANFLVAGMYPSTEYLMHWREYDGTIEVNTGADLPFTTGALPSTFSPPQFQVNVPATAADAAYPVVLFQLISASSRTTATDLAGNVIWYLLEPGVARMEAGGNFFAYTGGPLVGEYDLAGNVEVQTNLGILNEQLAAQGYPTLTSFNTHEARHLPDGNIVLLGARDVASTSAQGGTPANPVDILGDMVLVLDHNLQLVWAWDSFAHEDINRAAPLGETCTHGAPGCPAFSPSFTQANDWLHTNSVQGTADGNIILSQRDQDMVLKINYANGTGDGSVIWRMGAGLDFTIVNPPSQTCGTPNVFPWFTHQHDATFQFEVNTSASPGTIMTIFDDGNTRAKYCPAPQDSRGMVLFVHETARKVYIETSADLGAYSGALGSGQLLAPGDGNIYGSYGNGDLSPAGEAQSTETNLAGQIVYQLQVNSDSYRTYRLQNLYTPTFPFTATGIYPETPTPLQFGTIPFGTSEVLPLTLTNFGLPDAPTVGTSINGSSYKVLTTAQNTCTTGLTAGRSCTLPVEFVPASAAAHDDLLTIETDSSFNPVIELEGAATGLSATPQSLDFGTVPYGSSAVLTLTLTNYGVSGTIMGGTASSGASYSILTSAQNTCLVGIATGQSCTLPVQFTPDSVRAHNDVLTLTPTGGVAPIMVTLIGSGGGLTVSSSVLNFGTIAFGSTSLLPVTITDVGLPGTVSITPGVTGHSYKVVTTASQNLCLAGMTAGQSCTLSVEFDPNSVGGHGDLLTLTPSTAGAAPIPVGLEGTASN